MALFHSFYGRIIFHCIYIPHLNLSVISSIQSLSHVQFISSHISPYAWNRSIKKQRHHFADKGLCNQSHGWMWELDCKEGWVLKNWCFQTVVLVLQYHTVLLRVSWAARRSNQSVLKEINPEYSLEALMMKAEAPELWSPDAKNWLIGKELDAGKDWKPQKGIGRGWGGQIASLTQWAWLWASTGRY